MHSHGQDNWTCTVLAHALDASDGHASAASANLHITGLISQRIPKISMETHTHMRADREGVAVDNFILKEGHRVRVTNGGLEQPPAVLRVVRRHHLHRQAAAAG